MKTLNYRIEGFEIKVLPIFCWTFYFWSKSRVTKIRRIGKAGRRTQWSQALYIDIEDLIAERNNFRVAIGTTWTVLGKRLTLPVFRLLRMYVLSHGGFRYAFAECKMRARRRNSTYYGTIPSWGRKGGEEMGMRQGTIIVAAMRSFFFVSRNAFFSTVRVLFNCKRISILYKSMS